MSEPTIQHVHEFAEKQRLEGYRHALADVDDAFRERGPAAFRSWLEARCLEVNALTMRREPCSD